MYSVFCQTVIQHEFASCTNNNLEFHLQLLTSWCSQRKQCKRRPYGMLGRSVASCSSCEVPLALSYGPSLANNTDLHLMWLWIHDYLKLIAFLSMTTTRWSVHEPDRYMYTTALSSTILLLFFGPKKWWVSGWMIYCGGHCYWSSSPHTHV